MDVDLCFYLLLFLMISFIHAIRHGQNLIWAQSPTLRLTVSRLVGIDGDPTEWVKSGEVKVHHISAPHSGWKFKALAYQYSTQTLFWSESMNKRIQGLVLNGSTDTDKIVTGVSPDVEGLAVDWVSNNLYWTDSVFNWIKMTPINSNVTSCYKIIAQDGLDNPHGIAVYPQKGYLIWTDWGERPKIEIADLMGKNRRIIVDTDILHPRGMVIDYKENRLFWVDSKKDTIESVAFNGMDRKTVITQDGTNFYGIALYDKYVFVTEQTKGHLKIFDKNTGNNYISYKLTYIPYAIIMYDEGSQPGDTSMCDDMDCDQICVNDPIIGPQCVCGDGYSTIDNGKTCKLELKFSMPGHVYAINDAICQYPANLAYISLTNVTLENQCYLADRRGYLALTFDARNHNLYFSANNTKTISRVKLEVGANATTIVGGTGVVRGLSFDWLSGNLFWTDSTYKQIKVARKDGSHQKVVISSALNDPLGIAAHPGRGIIFWTDIGPNPKVETSYMDGSNRSIIMDQNLGSPNHLFIDFIKDRLYWADSVLHHVRCYDLQTNRITVYFTLNTSQFFGISIFKDFLLWTDSDDMNGLHVARMDTKEKVRGIIHPAYGIATDLITYDENNQPLFKDKNGDPLPCQFDNNDCEQLCLRGAKLTFYCECGLGYKLDDNSKTCSSTVLENNFLIVTDAYQKQIYQINAENGAVNAIDMTMRHQPIAIDFDPMWRRVYWGDNKARVIRGANIDGRMIELVAGLAEESVVDGLAVDFIHKLLYFTDTGLDTINVVSLTNILQRAVLFDTDMDEPRAIVLLPMEGTMFWTDWGFEPKIEMAQMDGTNRQTFLLLDKDSWPNGLTVDRKAKTLYWADAKYNKIEAIAMDKTNRRTVLQQEENAHYFGIFVMGQYLYFTDWQKTYVSRMLKEGGPVEQFGPPKFTRLYGIYGFNSSEIIQGTSVCFNSNCEHMCLPKPSGYHACRCRTGYALDYDMQSCKIEQSDTNATTPSTTSVAMSSIVRTTSLSSSGPRRNSTSSTINSSSRPSTSSTLLPSSSGTNVTNTSSTASVLATTISSTTEDELFIITTLYSSVVPKGSGLSGGSIAAIFVCSLIVIIVFVIFTIIAYKKYYIYIIPHGKLVEDKDPSIPNAFYRITFPDNNKDEQLTIDSGIENPTYDCYQEGRDTQRL